MKQIMIGDRFVRKGVTLLADNNGRNYILRLIQYLTLTQPTIQLSQFFIHKQDVEISDFIHRTRQILRIFKEFQSWKTILQQEARINSDDKKLKLAKKAYIIEKSFQSLFYIYDHFALLASIGFFQVDNKTRMIVSASGSLTAGLVVDPTYTLKMLKTFRYIFYAFKNVFRIIKCLIQIMIVLTSGKYNGIRIVYEDQKTIIKEKFLELIGSVLNIFVGCFYYNNSISAKKAKVMGIISSVISLILLWKRIN